MTGGHDSSPRNKRSVCLLSFKVDTAAQSRLVSERDAHQRLRSVQIDYKAVALSSCCFLPCRVILPRCDKVNQFALNFAIAKGEETHA